MMRMAMAPLAFSLASAAIVSAEEIDETVVVEPGGTLRIDLDRGRVTVHSHDDSAVHIEARARGFAAMFGGFELSHEGNDVTLAGRFSRAYLVVPWGPRVTVDAWVPREYSVVVHTSGGHIEVRDITGQTVAKTGGGHIDVRGAHGPVSVETSGGSIEVEEVEGSVIAHTSGGRVDIGTVEGNVEARTSGGALALQHVAGRIEATTSGGAISASFTGAPSGLLQTSGGQIEVGFPADAATDLDAETSGGSVSVEHQMLMSGSATRQHVSGKINGGGSPLRLRTSGGNIRVRAL